MCISIHLPPLSENGHPEHAKGELDVLRLDGLALGRRGGQLSPGGGPGDLSDERESHAIIHGSADALDATTAGDPLEAGLADVAAVALESARVMLGLDGARHCVCFGSFVGAVEGTRG
jgi:hypothetical protein